MNALIRALAAAQRALEGRRDRRDIKRGRVHADALKPGMRIMVECVVVDEPDDYPPDAHVHARPVKWQAGNQYVWYWRTRQRSDPAPWVEVVDG